MPSRHGRLGAAFLLLFVAPWPAAALSWPKLPSLPKVHLPSITDADEFDGGLTSIGMQAGATLPTGANGFSAVTSGGPAVNFRALHYLNSWIALGAEAGFSRFNRRIQETSPGGLLIVPGEVAQTTRAQTVTLDAVARINAFQQGSWTPYVLGGTGLSNFSAWGRATVPGAVPADQGFKSSNRGLYVTGSAGVEAFAIKGLSVSFEARYAKYPLYKAFRSKSAESLSYLLGVNVWFGKKL